VTLVTVTKLQSVIFQKTLVPVTNYRVL